MDKEVLEILKRLETKVDEVQTQQQEDHQILKALNIKLKSTKLNMIKWVTI